MEIHIIDSCLLTRAHFNQMPQIGPNTCLRSDPTIRPEYNHIQVSLVPQMRKDLPAVQETGVQSLGREEALEMEMATHSTILTYELPCTITDSTLSWGTGDVFPLPSYKDKNTLSEGENP